MPKRKIIIISLGLALLLLAGLGLVRFKRYYHLALGKQAIAAGGYTMELGMTGVTTLQCFTTGQPPVCTGGKLCSTLDPARCATFQEVTGMPAMARGGGSGVKLAQAGNAQMLFSLNQVTMAGISMGADVLAGCWAPTSCETGTVASYGGCSGSGCVAMNENADRWQAVRDALYYTIAGFK